MSTAELSSNLIYDPSGLGISFFVLTMTAFITSPFFTFELGMASLTDTTMISPTVAYRLLVPPSTLIHCISLAPELSATLSLVSVWIILAPHRFCADDFLASFLGLT